jgi:WD40 repeat protein
LRAQFDLRPEREIRALVWHAKDTLVAGGGYGSLWIWKRKGPDGQPKQIAGTGATIDSVAFGPGGDGLELAIGDRRPAVLIHNFKDNTNRELKTGRAVDDRSSPVDVSWCMKDGRLAVTNGGKTALILDPTSNAPPTKIASDDGKSINVVAWNQECTALAMGGDSDIYLWRKATGSVKKLNVQGPTPVNAPVGRKGALALAWHREGLTVASGSQDGAIIVTDRTFLECKICDSAESMLLGSHDKPVHGVAWGGPRGSQLASAGLDGTVRIWTKQFFSRRYPQQTIVTNQQGSLSVAWSPDGEELASGGADGTVKIWRTSDNSEPVELGGQSGKLSVPAPANPNDPPKLLFDDQPLSYSQLSELARQRSLRKLTPEECSRYLRTNTCPVI